MLAARMKAGDTIDPDRLVELATKLSCLFFLVAGHGALSYLGVTVHAFSISGGILLFATAMPMLFGHRPALQSNEDGQGGPEDTAISPLAIPLLAGPGTITTILLLTAQARGAFARLAAIAIALALVFLLTRFVLCMAGERLVRRRHGVALQPHAFPPCGDKS